VRARERSGLFSRSIRVVWIVEGGSNAPSKNLHSINPLHCARNVAAKANAQSIDELYQAAKNEGALSLNGGGPAGLYEPWVKEFEQRFPGIKVKLTADFSNILAPIIDCEIAEKKLSVI
jgi:hypothetical protein